MTTIHVHPEESTQSAPVRLTPLPMAGLLIAAWNLLDRACDLPQPHMITVHDLQSISLQFPADPASLRTITRWAIRFGGVFTSEQHHGKTGPEIWCRVKFDYYGVDVDAYAIIPASVAGT
jgi:hypothetical protein